MSKIISLDVKADDRATRHKEFRAQFATHFATNFAAALDRRGSIPAGYGRIVAVAEMFGVSQNTAASWLKGEGVPDTYRLPEIAEALNTTVEQLLNGERGSEAHLIDERYAAIETHSDEELDGHTLYALPETLRSVGLPRGIRIMRVQSEDMAPWVGSGDLVIYDPRVNRIHANGLFVFQVGERLILRRVQRDMKRNVRLICDNEKFADEVLGEADFAEQEQGDGRVVVIGYVLARILIGH